MSNKLKLSQVLAFSFLEFLVVVAIIGIFILFLIGSALMQSTDNPDVQKKIEDITIKGTDIILLILAVGGAIGFISLLAFLKSK